jgi:hypothetical protein
MELRKYSEVAADWLGEFDSYETARECAFNRATKEFVHKILETHFGDASSISSLKWEVLRHRDVYHYRERYFLWVNGSNFGELFYAHSDNIQAGIEPGIRVGIKFIPIDEVQN